MANIMQKTGAGITGVFARFRRNNRGQKTERQTRWYDCDVCSRGL